MWAKRRVSSAGVVAAADAAHAADAERGRPPRSARRTAAARPCRRAPDAGVGLSPRSAKKALQVRLDFAPDARRLRTRRTSSCRSPCRSARPCPRASASRSARSAAAAGTRRRARRAQRRQPREQAEVDAEAVGPLAPLLDPEHAASRRASRRSSRATSAASVDGLVAVDVHELEPGEADHAGDRRPHARAAPGSEAAPARDAPADAARRASPAMQRAHARHGLSAANTSPNSTLATGSPTQKIT